MSADAYAATVRAIRSADSVGQLDALANSVARAYPHNVDAGLLLDLIAQKRAWISSHD